MTIPKEIFELELELHTHKFRYYKLPNSVSISDYEYDLLEKELKNKYNIINRKPLTASALNTVGYNEYRHIAFVHKVKGIKRVKDAKIR